MRIVIAAGGTGGHVYPALAVSEAISSRRPDVDLSFVGSVGGFERPLVEESGVTFSTYHEVQAGPLHGVAWGQRLVSLVRLAIGLVQALGLVVRLKPNVLLLTGGWVGLPMALAAWLMRVPSLIFLPDVEPGLSIRALQRFARRVAITVPPSEAYFRAGQTVVTGYPLRRMMHEATREAAVAHFGFDPARQTLLVTGGSRGAQSINRAVEAIVSDLLADGVQIIHITGTLDWAHVEAHKATLTDSQHYHAFPYLHREMGLAYAAADLVICRAGASVLGELPYFALPSILVPYPHAWRYQKVNADYLAAQGAAVVLNDADMPRDLLATVREMLRDSAWLLSMRVMATGLATPDSAWLVAQELFVLAGETR